MSKEIHLNPLNEEDLEDKRNLIAENCFIEIDIAMKAYQISLGEDALYDELQLLHSTVAYILSNHNNEHQLANVDINEFEIPESPFKDKEGNWVDKLYSLLPQDLISYLMNLVMNSKRGMIELLNSEYFNGTTDTIIEAQSLFHQLISIYDRTILLINNKYSKLILNQNT